MGFFESTSAWRRPDLRVKYEEGKEKRRGR
jgi:hypothetical protein